MKTKAFSRLQATGGVQSLDLPPFRYVSDVQRFLESLVDQLRDLSALVKVQQQQLARLQKPTLLKATAVEINKKVAPGIRKLESQYNLIQDLHDLYRTVESAESQTSLQFDERSGQVYTGVQGLIKTLKSDISDRMRDVFKFLQDIADKHVPSKFRTYMNSVVSAVEHQVPEAQVRKTFLYASVCPRGCLVFTFYLYLVGETDDDHLYVSIQWIVGAETNVQVNHEFATPDELFEIGPGQGVDSANDAVKVVLTLLNGEGMNTEFARGPQSEINYPEDEHATAALARSLAYF